VHHDVRDSKGDVSGFAMKVRCREIGPADFKQIIDLVTPAYDVTRAVWESRMRRLTDHASPAGYPKYGLMLECEGRPVGTIFTMFTSVTVNEETKIRCYLMTRYVDPAFRNYGTMLAMRALKYKDVTYRSGSTPWQHVIPLLKAQGYTRWCEGRMIAVAALSFRFERVRVTAVSADTAAGCDLMPFEVELFSRHAAYGCLTLMCRTETGEFPFVFQPRRKGGMVPFARLVYCRDIADLVRFAGPIGRYLLRRGLPLVVFDADGPVRGIVGSYSNKFPKFFKGPDRPRLGEDAYTSRVIFDF
jgi:hypothetical protein